MSSEEFFLYSIRRDVSHKPHELVAAFGVIKNHIETFEMTQKMTDAVRAMADADLYHMVTAWVPFVTQGEKRMESSAMRWAQFTDMCILLFMEIESTKGEGSVVFMDNTIGDLDPDLTRSLRAHDLDNIEAIRKFIDKTPLSTPVQRRTVWAHARWILYDLFDAFKPVKREYPCIVVHMHRVHAFVTGCLHLFLILNWVRSPDQLVKLKYE